VATLLEWVRKMGIQKITGRIKDIKRGTIKRGKSAGSPYYRVELENGDSFLAWEWEKIRDIKIGQEAEFEVQEWKDKLQILSSLPIINRDDELGEEKSIEDKPKEEKPKQKDVFGQNLPRYEKPVSGDKKDNPKIARMSAIKSAVDLVISQRGSIADIDKALEDVLVVAARFLEYINNEE